MGLEARKAAVQEAIRGVLDDPALRGAALVGAIDDLGGLHGIEPFRACLAALVRIDRAEASARSLLLAVEEHRAALETRLGRDPGLAVAALDFLHELEGTLRDPAFRQDGGPEPVAPAPERSARPLLPIDETLFLELRRSERFGRPLALALLAPDRPPADGEAPIAAAAAALREACRDTDHVARVVPEGFVVILPGTARDEALRAAERLRRALSAASGAEWSVGLACCPELPRDMTEVARASRQALRGAREAGGGRVVCFQPERRGHPRKRQGLERVAALLRRGAGECPVELQDLSIGGALLRLAERLEPGSRVTLALAERGTRPLAVTLEGHVVRSDGPDVPGGATWSTAVAFREEGMERFRLTALLAGGGDPPGEERA